jgi:GDSL-like lipase/acylhydrolase family protein
MGAEHRRGPCRTVAASLVAAAGGFFLLLEACFGPAKPPPAALPVETRLSSPEALAPFFTALEASKNQPPVRILQIGDSHTANDSLSGRLRERLQARFGAAGRGWLPAGIPFRYYRPALVGVSESGWQHETTSNSRDLAMGLDAVAAVSQPPDATMTIASTETAGFDRFAVEFLTRPNGPAFTVAVDGGPPVRGSTAAASPALKTFDLPLEHPARQVELRTEGRDPVALLGWTVERQHAGVIYENHGTIGATVDLLGRMAPEAVSFELGERRPALLIVGFGTNEGFDDSLELGRYAARFAANLETLRRAAHGVPVLVLGAPDGNRVARGCAPVACGSGAGDCTWHEPANLAAIRDIQRRVAAQQGWSYWDWFGAMGGSCSIDRMASADPPRAARDHVHLTKSGYEGTADLLYGDVMRAYEIWKASPRTS